MDLMVLFREGDRECFTLRWEGYAYIHLPQGYQHSLQPITPQLLSWRKWPDGVAKVYEHTDDVLIGGAVITEVGRTQSKILDNVEKKKTCRVSRGWMKALLSGTTQQDKRPWVETGTQKVSPEHSLPWGSWALEQVA